MKKVLTIMLAAVLVLALAACGNSDSSGNPASSGSALSGTFLDETGSVSLTFAGDKVTLEFPKDKYKTEGTYKIADGTLTMQFKEPTPMSGRALPYKFEGKDLILDGEKLKKQ